MAIFVSKKANNDNKITITIKTDDIELSEDISIEEANKFAQLLLGLSNFDMMNTQDNKDDLQ